MVHAIAFASSKYRSLLRSSSGTNLHSSYFGTYSCTKALLPSILAYVVDSWARCLPAGCSLIRDLPLDWLRKDSFCESVCAVLMLTSQSCVLPSKAPVLLVNGLSLSCSLDHCIRFVYFIFTDHGSGSSRHHWPLLRSAHPVQ